MFSALSLFALLAAFTGCGGNSKPISVAVTAAASTVDGNDTTTLTAAVTHDKNSGGVKWTLSGEGTLSNTTTSSATYTAPAATSSSQSATITATSVADSSKSGTATITIPAAPAVTTTSSTLTGAVGTAFSITLAGSGGIPPYQNWAVYTAGGGNSLPSCLALSSAGVITTASGTAPDASCAGTYSNLYFQFTDSGTPTPLTATSPALTITITAAPAITFGSAPTATGTFNTAYSSAIAATGGAGTLTYSIATGALPPDFALSSSGAIAGTPKAKDVGTFTFSIKAADAYGDSAVSPVYTIKVSYPVIIATPTTPPTGYVGSTYPNTQLTATGGNGGPYIWTWFPYPNSSLPPGLNLSTGGLISGQPTAQGTYTVTANATDSTSINNGSVTLVFTIDPGVTITTPTTLPTGYGSTPYSQTLAASGGTGSGYVWSITSGASQVSSLSLTLTGAGVLSGTPPQAGGTASFSVKVTDSASNTATATFSLTINQGVIPVAPTLPDAYPGVAYTSAAFTATGGTGSGYTWSWAAASGSSLPSGFSISPAGTISASNPANSGTTNLSYNIVVTATDSAGNKGSVNITLIVEAPITISPTTLPSASINVNYSDQLSAAGGSGTYINWQVTTGASTLSGSPFNISMSKTGLLSGTPGSAAAGLTANFTVQATDSNGHSGIANYSITVYAGLAITTTVLPSADVGSAYNFTLTAAGGSGSGYKWTATNSNLSTYGLSLSSSGAITGTPTGAGNIANFTANVTDSANNTATQALTIPIYYALQLPTPDPASLPQLGYSGQAYTGSISGQGGTGTYSWSVSGLTGTGLSANGSGSTLSITGSPSSAGTITFGVTLTDTAANNVSITQTGYTISVSNPTAVTLPPASPQPSSLPAATVNQSYTGNIDSSGGVGPYTWTVNGAPTNGSGGASLGNGLAAVNTGGSALLITGTPTSSGTVNLTNVKVTDSTQPTNTSATQSYTITVNPVSTIQISFYGIAQGMVNMPYTFNSLNISGGTSPYTVTYSNLPDGLSQQSGTWNLVGTPTSAASTTVTVNVTDSTSPVSEKQSATFTLTVVPETVAANNSELKGQYACYVEKYWDGGVTGGAGNTLYRGAAVFAISANGSGSITGGEIDSNSPDSGYKSATANGAVTGTYAVGSDNRGYIIIANDGPTFAIAGGNLNSSSQFTEFALTEMDDAGASPSKNTSGGRCYLQNTTSLSGETLDGSAWVWALRGEASDASLTGAVGAIGFASSSSISGSLDEVAKGVYSGEVAMTGNSLSTADSFGRITFNLGSSGKLLPFVVYITNSSAGEMMVMTANPHNASSNAQILYGEARLQNASALKATYPLSGSMVMYSDGLETSTGYKAFLAPMSVNSSTGAYSLGPMLQNEEGTFNPQSAATGTWTSGATDSTTGRTPFGLTGDVIYVYDTGSAAVLMADVGNGGGSTPQNQLGWIEPQTAPTSGTWALGDLATSVFSYSVPNGDYNADFNAGAITINSSGDFTYYAQDDGGQSWADWDEPCTNDNGGAATCVFVPDTTYDPNGTYGIFDANLTPQGGTTQAQAYCIAISVDKATNSKTRGRMICLDATSKSPQLSIAQE
jgi:hypothetical protein